METRADDEVAADVAASADGATVQMSMEELFADDPSEDGLEAAPDLGDTVAARQEQGTVALDPAAYLEDGESDGWDAKTRLMAADAVERGAKAYRESAEAGYDDEDMMPGNTVASPMAQAALKEAAAMDTEARERVERPVDDRGDGRTPVEALGGYRKPERRSVGGIVALLVALALIAAAAAAWMLPASHVLATVGGTTFDMGVNLFGFTLSAEADTDEGKEALQMVDVRFARFVDAIDWILGAYEGLGGVGTPSVRVESSLPFAGTDRLLAQAEYVIAAREQRSLEGSSGEGDYQEAEQADEYDSSSVGAAGQEGSQDGGAQYDAPGGQDLAGDTSEQAQPPQESAGGDGGEQPGASDQGGDAQPGTSDATDATEG